MRLLHDLSKALPPLPPRDVTSDLSISITYSCKSVTDAVGGLEWFTRDLEEQTALARKRPGSVFLSEGAQADASKRKEVREAKKVDVGSLLDAFT